MTSKIKYKLISVKLSESPPSQLFTNTSKEDQIDLGDYVEKGKKVLKEKKFLINYNYGSFVY